MADETSPVPWADIKQAFNDALDLPAEERKAFVERLAEANPELSQQVSELLENHDASDTFLENSAVIDLRHRVVMSPRGGDRLGPYRIEREIGRGGMGRVYLASRQSDFEQRVAIKWIHGDGGNVVERFLAERQILANLDHPNIARLLDGGTTDDGTPYLVMEYIEGVPIDVYCREHGLSLGRRLRLLRTVCEAVHYAHQNLVVHRDLKPSNILVTADGTPKLLDFGIAKLLNADQSPREGLTQRTHAPMTPRYASPEQVRGEPVSTASDIYALGVLAYELLSGSRPYEIDPGRPAEMVRIVCDVEPTRPSSAAATWEDSVEVWPYPEDPARTSRLLRGDLDKIVRQALHKEPHRRYASAAALGEEIRRHLAGLPVEARGVGFRYLAGKWIQRHRGWVAAGLLLLLAIGVGVVTTARQSHLAEQERIRAENERARAERRFEEVRHLANTFLFDVHDAIAHLPGSLAARRTLAATAQDYLERLAAEGDDDPELRMELGTAWLRLGDVQGTRHNASLGDTAAALASYRRGLELLDDATDAQATVQLANAHQSISSMLELQGDYAGALERQRQAMELWGSLARQNPHDWDSQKSWSESLHLVGDLLKDDEQFDSALEHHHRALEIRRTAMEELDDLERRLEVSDSHLRIGDVFYAQKEQRERALEEYSKALAITRDIEAEWTPQQASSLEYQNAFLRVHSRMADVLEGLGRFQEAHDQFSIAEAIAARLAADPLDGRAQRDHGLTLNGLGDTLAQMGKSWEAIEQYRRSFDLAEARLTADPSNARARRDLAVVHYNIGLTYGELALETPPDEARRHWQEARTWFEGALGHFRHLESLGVTPQDANNVRYVLDEIEVCDENLAKLGG